MFNPVEIKKDFPILWQDVHRDKQLVYLDSAATSQKPQCVIDAISSYYSHDNANIHRGVHVLGDRSTKIWNKSKEAISNFFGADKNELIFVRNTTEAINMVAYAWMENRVAPGDILISTQMEHHSNLVPWQELARRKKAELLLIPITDTGELNIGWLEECIEKNKERIKLIAFTHVSNTLGTLNDVKTITSKVRSYFSPTTQPTIVIDGAQAAPHFGVKFHDLGVDFYAVSAHKMLGPMGIGGLIVASKVLLQLKPWLFGGGMIDQVDEKCATYSDDADDRFTAGTPDVVGAYAWAVACEYLTKIGMGTVLDHDQFLVKQTIELLSAIPEITILGPLHGHRVGSVSFTYKGVHAHDVAQILDSQGVAVRSGHHCTMPLHTKLDIAASTRASFNVYTTSEDIQTFVSALSKVKEVFK